MTERTLREKIQALIDRQYSIDPDDLQALLDAHTAVEPPPDAVAEVLEAAAAIADEYASENFRMATDSVLLDRMQDFSQTDERQVEGNGHSAAGIASRNIAAAIRALAKGSRP